MKYLLLIGLFLSLAGCNSVDAVNAASYAIEPLSSVVNYDTNGFYSKRTTPHTKVCPVKIRENYIAYKPC